MLTFLLSLATTALVRTPTKTVVADGVYLFTLPDIDSIEVDGNAIVIVNAEDVVVFDANVTASSTRAIIAEIRELTPKPVRYVINSHWHPDHWTGNEIYAREFPGVDIIASQTTWRLMENTFHISSRKMPKEVTCAARSSK